MKKVLGRIFVSKKIWVAIASMIAELINAKFGVMLTPEVQITIAKAIAAIAAAFMLGQGAADYGSKGRTSAGRDIYD